MDLNLTQLENFWKSFIMPNKIAYSEDDIGPYKITVNNITFKKAIYKIINDFNEAIFLTVYLPSDN